MNDVNCYIEEHYKIEHYKVSEKLRVKFYRVGGLFGGKPICESCLGGLLLVTDHYGYPQLEEAINRSQLKPVFEDYDVAEIKFNLGQFTREVQPHNLHIVRGAKWKIRNITIDDATKTIIAGKKFGFFGKRRTIPFSDVVRVGPSERAGTHYDIDGGRPRDLVTEVYYDIVIVFVEQKKGVAKC